MLWTCTDCWQVQHKHDASAILEVDGIVVGQSKSIERVVAKKYGFASVETEVDKFFVTDLPEWFHKVEKALKLTSTTPGVAVGSNLSHADLSIYYTLVFYLGSQCGSCQESVRQL